MSVVRPYRIRHKLTGLYYSPRSNSNLSEKERYIIQVIVSLVT